MFLPSSANGHGLTGSFPRITDMSQIEGEIPMSTHHRSHGTSVHEPGSPVTRLASNPPQHHTHVQQVAPRIQVDHPGGSRC